MNENGEYDGDDHDVPAHDLELIAHHYGVLRMATEAVRDRG